MFAWVRMISFNPIRLAPFIPHLINDFIYAFYFPAFQAGSVWAPVLEEERFRMLRFVGFSMGFLAFYGA